MKTRPNGSWKTLAMLTAITFAGIVSVWAEDFVARRLVQVSGPSPFADCTADQVVGLTGPPILNVEG